MKDEEYEMIECQDCHYQKDAEFEILYCSRCGHTTCCDCGTSDEEDEDYIMCKHCAENNRSAKLE